MALSSAKIDDTIITNLALNSLDLERLVRLFRIMNCLDIEWRSLRDFKILWLQDSKIQVSWRKKSNG